MFPLSVTFLFIQLQNVKIQLIIFNVLEHLPSASCVHKLLHFNLTIYRQLSRASPIICPSHMWLASPIMVTRNMV
jgi:hypothetical protein